MRFQLNGLGCTSFQGGTTAPLKLLRPFNGAAGRCELPLLHTAGGLVGGDQLAIKLELAPNSCALITSVAAQKIYGTRGRSRLDPNGRWAEIKLRSKLAAGADLEWLPQETVVFKGGLLEQQHRVELAENASWLGIDVVRLGRTASGETLGSGCWRSSLEIRRHLSSGVRWELVDRLQIEGNSLNAAHGLQGQPVLGSLVWAAPNPLDQKAIKQLLLQARQDSLELEGEMAISLLPQGVIARYLGPSSQAARFWFCRLWMRIRELRCLAAPTPPRVWPIQENPYGKNLN